MSEHLVQLFDAPRSLADAAARFLAEGWVAGERILTVARPRHWELIAAYLQRHGCAAATGSSNGSCEFVDAEALLRRMRRRGTFSTEAARQELGATLARAEGQPLRIYGEGAELLAEEGDFESACRLEDLWNDLQQPRPFRLLCGYMAPHFADPRTATALKTICGKHTRVRTQPADSLGTWLTGLHAGHA